MVLKKEVVTRFTSANYRRRSRIASVSSTGGAMCMYVYMYIIVYLLTCISSQEANPLGWLSVSYVHQMCRGAPMSRTRGAGVAYATLSQMCSGAPGSKPHPGPSSTPLHRVRYVTQKLNVEAISPDCQLYRRRHVYV